MLHTHTHALTCVPGSARNVLLPLKALELIGEPLSQNQEGAVYFSFTLRQTQQGIAKLYVQSHINSLHCVYKECLYVFLKEQ